MEKIIEELESVSMIGDLGAWFVLTELSHVLISLKVSRLCKYEDVFYFMEI